MRTFVYTLRGVARIMRTYAMGSRGRAITLDPADADIPEIIPAPDAAELIANPAKWHPDEAAEVTSTREISESDIPSDTTFKDAWQDDGTSITVDMPKARAIHAVRIAQARNNKSAQLGLKEAELRLRGKATEADKAAGDRAVVDGADLGALGTQIAAAPNPTALKAVWPARVPKPF